MSQRTAADLPDEAAPDVLRQRAATMTLRGVASVTWIAALVLASRALAAQQPVTRDSLRLRVLQEEALHADPRQREFELGAAQTQLRLQTIAAEQLPALGTNGRAQYQSQVPSIPISLPGVSFPVQPHDTYDAYLSAQQSVYSPGIAPRRATERAQWSESQAQLRTTLYGLRQEVEASFFAAASQQHRATVIATTIADLEARWREAVQRVSAGTSLPSDTSTIEATILQRHQDALDAATQERAALARLSTLVGHPVLASDALALPDAGALVSAARQTLDDVRARPEYRQYAATRDRLGRQAAVYAAQVKPQVSAFARLGYGRPGLNALSPNFTSYWLAGLQFQWTPWDWGTTGRQREVLALQQQIVVSDEAAFTSAVRRSVQADLAAIDQLEGAMALDDRIIVLRQQIEHETNLRLQEGVVTASEYVDRANELLMARLTRGDHRIALAQARARFLTILGIETPP